MSEMLEYMKLAVDRRGVRFLTEPEAIEWQVELVTNGPSVPATRRGVIVRVPIDASPEDIEEQVGHAPGWYCLRQVAKDGSVLDARCGYIEIRGVNLGLDMQRYGLEEALALCKQMAQANAAKDELVADMTKTLLHTHVQLQLGAVRMLEAASTTIGVATGIEAIEHEQPVIDISEMTAHILEAIDDKRKDEPTPEARPSFIEVFLTSDTGQQLTTMVNKMLMAWVMKITNPTK